MSTRGNPVSAYRETSVRTASGGKIIVMLYDEAVKQLDTAVALLDADTKELDRVNNAILKTQDIITELMVSLDFDKGGDIAPKLFGLYRFFNEQLMEANVKKDAEPLRAVRGFLSDLRDAWYQILGKTHVQGTVSSGVNIAG
jgi:flagellar protein FliS